MPLKKNRNDGLSTPVIFETNTKVKEYSNLNEQIRTLNHIITIENALVAIPFGEKFIDFFLEGFRSIVNIESVLICLSSQKKCIGNLRSTKCENCQFFNNPEINSCLLAENPYLKIFPIGTFQHKYGSIAFEISPNFSLDLLPALYNFVNSFTIYIENDIQKKKIQKYNEELVLHRKDLENTIKEKVFTLEKQNLEYVILNDEYQRQTKSLLKAQKLGKIGNWEIDETTGVITCSPQIFEIFKLSPNDDYNLSVETYFNFIHPDDKSFIIKTHNGSLETKESYELDHRLKLSDGTIGYVTVKCEVISDENGKVVTTLGTIQDITERKLITQKLKESIHEVAEVKKALDQTSMVSITDLEGVIKSVNRNFCEKSKYSEEELVGRNHSIVNSGYHSNMFFDDFWSTIKKGSVWKGEIKNKTKDGFFYWVEAVIIPSLNKTGEIIQYVAINKDITSRKAAELLLAKERKSILRAQFEGEEREKNRISVELHDGLGQILTAAKFSLAALGNKKELSEVIKKKVLDIKAIVNEANIETGRISKDLLPRVLEDYGLEKAVEKILLEVNKSVNIKTVLTLDPEVKIIAQKSRIIYRIIQESINNVVKHSNATTLEVKFDTKGNYDIISILDNGDGFLINHYKSGLGLENLKQRALSIDANLDIQSKIGEGTCITLKYSHDGK